VKIPWEPFSQNLLHSMWLLLSPAWSIYITPACLGLWHIAWKLHKVLQGLQEEINCRWLSWEQNPNFFIFVFQAPGTTTYRDSVSVHWMNSHGQDYLAYNIEENSVCEHHCGLWETFTSYCFYVVLGLNGVSWGVHSWLPKESLLTF
jgi:hypothetical protein